MPGAPPARTRWPIPRARCRASRTTTPPSVPGIVFNSTTDYFRVRYSVAGLGFTAATLYLAAHADGSGLPRLQVQSQLHGEYLFQPTVPISTHRLYTLDWTPYLAPGDAPGLTAVTLRPMPTGVAVSQLELCVQ
jgi:hypothetical protein